MIKYFIQINQNEKGLYDFIIESINEAYMEEKTILGIKNDIEDLDDCYKMIKDFPLSSISELSLIQLNRYNKKLRPTVFELSFNESINRLIESNKRIRAYEFN